MPLHRFFVIIKLTNEGDNFGTFNERHLGKQTLNIGSDGTVRNKDIGGRTLLCQRGCVSFVFLGVVVLGSVRSILEYAAKCEHRLIFYLRGRGRLPYPGTLTIRTDKSNYFTADEILQGTCTSKLNDFTILVIHVHGRDALSDPT